MKMRNKVIIVGGGISGLATAHRFCELQRGGSRPLEITILEAKPRLGGVIETWNKDGFLMEGGPDSFISEKPAAQELSARLGIASEILDTNDKLRRSFIYKKGKLIAVPEGFYLIAPSQIRAFLMTPLLGLMTKLRMGCELFIPRRKTLGDESVAGFVRRRFGETLLKQVAQPMIGGIYTADPEHLSLGATMPQFQELERRYGSVIRGLLSRRKQRSKHAAQTASGPRYSLFLSFRGGMETLTRAVRDHLPGVRVKISSEVTEIHRESGGWNVTTRSGEFFEADALCLALTAHHAVPLLSGVAPELSRELQGIPYESVATVNLAYHRADIPHPLNGFGFVVPAFAQRRIVACSFSSVKFHGRAPEGKVLLRAFVGGALHREVYALDDQAMEQAVREELRHYLGVEKAPFFSFVRRYPHTMPQYQVGHTELVNKIRGKLAAFPGLYLAGNAYRGIGVPDCVKWAETTAESMHQFFEKGNSPFKDVRETVPFKD